MSQHDDLDPLNSPSRDSYHQIESTSPFSRMFSSSSISEPPLIDFTSSPSPPRQSHPFVPLPLSLPSNSQSKQSLFPPSTSNTRQRSSPLKFSILEDSFSDLPPPFPSTLSHLEERSEEEEGGLVSFIQDSPPVKRLEKENQENVSPTRRRSGGGSGRKWGVMQKLKEDRLRRRSTSLSPVKEAGGASPYSARDGDSIAQISEVDLSLIQDEAGSFLLPDDDSTTGQSFERSVGDGRAIGNLSQIGEEEEEEDSKGVEEVSVGLNTMFLQPRAGTEIDVSHVGDQSQFVPFEGGQGGKKPVFDQSTLPRQFAAPPSLTRSNSSSSILPPELVSPMKSYRPRPPPSASSYLPTPDPSPLLSTDQPLPFDQSSLSFALPAHQSQDTPFDQTFLNKSSVSFIKECKTPRTARRQARVSDSSSSNTSGSSSGISQVGVGEGEEGEMTDFGFTQFGLFGKEGETSTAILEQLPPTSIFNPESTRTIELCLQRPILPTHTGDPQEEEDLASSTRTVKASDSSLFSMDLMGMEEPSMFLKSNESGVGEMTMEMTGSGEGTRETGAERLKRRMKELRAAQTQTQQGSTIKNGAGRSLYTVPSTPSAASSTRTGSSRFVSLLDQTPQPQSLETQRRTTASTVRPAPSSSARGAHVGTLISFDTPSTRRPASTLAAPAPVVPSTTSRTRARSSLLPPPSSRQLPEAPKTPGERKESTRARLERMRSERKVREEETLSSSSDGAKGNAGGLKRSNSVGTRLGVGKAEGGMTRSRSTTGVVGKTTSTTTLADRMLASKPPTKTSRSSETKVTTAPRKSTIAMPPPSSTSPSNRRSSLVPSTSTSRLVKRPSLLPTSSSTSSLPSISKREPLKPTTAISRPAGTGSRK